MNNQFALSVFVFCLLLAIQSAVLAQTPPASQTAGGVVQQEQQELKQKKIEDRIREERETGEAASQEEIVAPDQGRRVLVSEIRVEGATLLSAEKIQQVVAPYENQELTFRTMQKIADEITDQYRKKGYMTSRAYLPPQTIEDGVLMIRVVEGRLGNLTIKGNQHFRTEMLKRKIDIDPEGYFDYSALQKSLIYINEHPDRMAKAILVPGKKPGTTDVVIEVEDRLPVHVGFKYDNWGSRFIDRSRYATILEHNDVTGHDDKLYLKAQAAENQQLALGQMRYSYPISSTLEIGTYAVVSKVRSGDEFAATNTEGTAKILGVFGTKQFIQNDQLEVRGNFGFDHKSIQDESLAIETSHDEVRVLKAGVDIDYSDQWGRTILTTEIDQGLPGIFGAMDDKDPSASRSGAGAKFTKGIINVFRLQPLAWETALLWKNTWQLTNHRLIAAEQFQIGGATTVRGYTPAEFSGDKGVYTSLEWSIPFYFISREARVPFYKKDRWYDVLRFVIFWDWGQVRRVAPASGETTSNTIQGAGFGVRMNLSEHLDCRIEIGYPIGAPNPSDGDHMHPWVEFSYKF